MREPSVTTGVYLTQALRAYGVETVFGIPGVHTIELYRGLRGSGLRHVTPRHEQGAGFMADGYARASGRPGVCFIITGPGLTNIATAMAQAYGDSVPMLVISSVNAHGRMGSGEGWLHELPNQQGLMAGVSAFSRTIHSPEEIAPALAQAFAVFEGARPRPVHLEIPINVLGADAGHLAPPRPMRVVRPAPSNEGVMAVVEALEAAKRPVLLAGGGARAADMGLLAEALDAPLVMTVNGRGLLPPSHPLAVSLSPSASATRALLAEADLVLAIGTEIGSTDYDMYEDGGLRFGGRLLRIDIDAVQMARGPLAEVAVVADAAEAVADILALLPEERVAREGAARAARAMAGLADLPPAYQGDLALLAEVQALLPDAVFVGDSTQMTYAGNMGFAANAPGRYFNSATGYGTLGYGLPAALGAALAKVGPVLCLTGDGGLQFSLAELATASAEGLPVILLVHDNGGYGEIKTAMEAAAVQPIGVDVRPPDLAEVALACGWHVADLTARAGLAPQIIAAAARSGPTLLRFGDAFRAQYQPEGGRA